MPASRTALRVGAAPVAVGARSVPVLVNIVTATTLNVVPTTSSHDFRSHKIMFPMRGSTESSSVSGTRSRNTAGVQVSSKALIYQGRAPDVIGVTTVPAHIVHLTNPGTEAVKVNTAYRLVLRAADSQNQRLTLTASGLSRGLTLTSSPKTITFH